MTELKCSPCIDCDYPEDYRPPNCPVCGGFLVWKDEGEEHEQLTPICHKCGVELIVLSETFEDGEIMEGYYKICPISGRKKGLGAKSQGRER